MRKLSFILLLEEDEKIIGVKEIDPTNKCNSLRGANFNSTEFTDYFSDMVGNHHSSILDTGMYKGIELSKNKGCVKPDITFLQHRVLSMDGFAIDGLYSTISNLADPTSECVVPKSYVDQQVETSSSFKFLARNEAVLKKYVDDLVHADTQDVPDSWNVRLVRLNVILRNNKLSLDEIIDLEFTPARHKGIELKTGILKHGSYYRLDNGLNVMELNKLGQTISTSNQFYDEHVDGKYNDIFYIE